MTPVTSVRSPGSSANLGPGFDVLGVALDSHVTIADEGVGSPCGPDHIARIAYERAGGSSDVWFDFDLVPGRGLGFSAAARAAGAVLGRLHCGDQLDDARHNAYEVVFDLEGHGDNAAPSVYGGLFVIAGDLAHPVAAELPGAVICWVPESETPTDESRACLPDVVSRSDAVFNLGRVGLLMSALYEGNGRLLRRATEDRLHQPSRLAAAPASADALAAALEAGALAAWLSGSGPTIAVVAATDEVDQVAAALPAGGDVLRLEVDTAGSVIVG